MTRNLLEAGHDVTVASRSRGADRPRGRARRSRRRRPGRRRRRERSDDPLRPRLPDVVGGRRRAAARARSGQDRRRHARPSTPTSSARSTRGSTATGAAYLDAPFSGGTVGAEDGTLTLMVGGDAAALDAARARARPVQRAHRARRRPGHGPGREAVQPPDLRRADARDGGGERAGREDRRRPDHCVRGHHARAPATASRYAPAVPPRASCPDSPAIEQLGARLHDRPDGQGHRPRARLRGADRRAADCSAPASCAAARRGERGRLRPRGLLGDRQDRAGRARRLREA